MEFKCPNCNAEILSRCAPFCSDCRQPLPKSLLLTDVEMKALDKETEAARKRSVELQDGIAPNDVASQAVDNLPSPGDINLD